MAEILVVNNSKHNAAITFSFRDGNFPDVNYRPKVYRIERWSVDSVPVLYDTVSVYTRKENDSTWYVELPPGNALVIAEGLNLDMRNDGQLKMMLGQSRSLKVMMPNDANIECNGSGCYSSVRKFSRARAGIVLQ